MESIDNLIDTLELVRNSIAAKDKDMGFEAVTIFLTQFMDTFGHAPNIVAATFPILGSYPKSVISLQPVAATARSRDRWRR